MARQFTHLASRWTKGPRPIAWVLFAFAFAGLTALTPTSAGAAPGDLLFTLRPPEPIAGINFGDTLGVTGDNILVGAPRMILGGQPFVGEAYVFDGRTGELRHRLQSPTPAREGQFGAAMVGVGGRIVVTEVGVNRTVIRDFHEIELLAVGAAHVFDEQTGAFLRTLEHPEPESGAGFGTSVVRLSGDEVVLAAPSQTVDGIQSAGAAYVMNVSTGALRLTIPNPEPAWGDALGTFTGLAAWDDHIYMGSILDDLFEVNDNLGSVRSFDAATGQQVLRFDNPRPEPASPHFLLDWFGQSVDAGGGLLAVGARKEDADTGVEAGAVHVFDALTGALRLTIPNPHPEESGNFGRSVAVAGGNILVGAWGNDVAGLDRAGRAYLFDGATGGLLLELTNPAPEEFGAFGWQVAALGDKLIVSAASADSPEGLINTGAVYVFQNVPEPSTFFLLLLGAGGFLLVGAGRRTIMAPRPIAWALFAFAFAGLTALAPSTARAERVRFLLTGAIDVHDPFGLLPAGIETGMPFSGSLAYERDLPDRLPDDPRRGVYTQFPPLDDLGFLITIGDHEFRTDPASGYRFTLKNDLPLGLFETGEPAPPIGDAISVDMVAILPIELEFPRIQFYWQDLTLQSFDNDLLPSHLDVGLLKSVDADLPIVEISAHHIGTVTTGPLSFKILARIETISAVPEPESFVNILIMLGCGCLFYLVNIILPKCGMNGGAINRCGKLASLLAALLAFPVAAAQAETVRLKMTGTVSVYDPTLVLPEGVVEGAPFTAILVYDDSVPDSLPDDPQKGRYIFDGSGLEYGLSLSIGGLFLVNDPTDDFQIEITNDVSPLGGIGPPGDFFVVRSISSLGGPDFGFPKIQMWWSNTGAASSWNSDALPTSLDPALFERADVLASGGVIPMERPYAITAVVDEARPVSEPTAWALSLFLAAIFWRPFLGKRGAE